MADMLVVDQLIDTFGMSLRCHVRSRDHIPLLRVLIMSYGPFTPSKIIFLLLVSYRVLMASYVWTQWPYLVDYHDLRIQS